MYVNILSVLAIMSETNMPLKVVASCPPVMPVTIVVRTAQPSSAASDSA